MKLPAPIPSLFSLAFLATPALSSQPPADEGGGTAIQIRPLQALAPIPEQDLASSSPFVVAIFGPVAQKIYYLYAPKQKYDLSYPYAPLSRIVATHGPGLSCYRRIAKFGPEQFRCNLVFHPATPGGNQLSVPPYTYELVPQFGDGKLQSLALTLTGDEAKATAFLLQAQACPRLSAWDFSGSNLPCAYQVNQGSAHDAYFPDDIFPQGVAVGWGIVQR